MFRNTILLTAAILCLAVGFASAAEVSMKISGAGAVNDSTIKAGEKVTLDIYIMNDAEYTFFQLGFKMTSPDIAAVQHPADSGKGLNPNGDVKAFNGFENGSVFDMGGLHFVENDWDGKIPEVFGFGGLCIQNTYKPHDLAKMMSIEMVFDQPGTVVIDSSWFPPKGEWMFAKPRHAPVWKGPYKFTVVK